ncbi:MAG TPA: 3-hydroxyacyl-CoA dehydrogenase NAD-binding domain-containing protein [Myxococcota bacterium]|nr:3-hydroxyacyl-CoA dehydrogenase NAD-binding domain-containing protein [Myxococcota bacterium]HQK52574.1 3-hydroxyacyl-CoA dehydrogenase NAD-binding domain-containing protein [Myxococcota bacterium]
MRILVLGTGRMGRDMARTALGAGWDVTVASRDEGRLAACLAHLGRDIRRLRADGGPVGPVRGLLPGMDPGGPFDVLYETVEEDLEAKRQVLESWLPFRATNGIVLTNTSSLIPWEIHPEALGLHLFYPTMLTGFCEVVLPEGCGDPVRQRLMTLAGLLGLRPIVEIGPRCAQAVNRLLLPSQAWAVRQVIRGLEPSLVDEAFGRAWPGLRPLALMDSVGPETIARSVASYRRRMEPEEARSYEELEAALRVRARRGRWGSGEDRDPCREPAPQVPEGAGPEELARDAAALFLRTCRVTLDQGILGEEDLVVALGGLLGASWPPAGSRDLDWRRRCEERWQDTGLPWWRPPEPEGPDAGPFGDPQVRQPGRGG